MKEFPNIAVTNGGRYERSCFWKKYETDLPKGPFCNLISLIDRGFVTYCPDFYQHTFRNHYSMV